MGNIHIENVEWQIGSLVLINQKLSPQNLSITDHSERKSFIVRSKVRHPGINYETKIIALFTKFKILYHYMRFRQQTQTSEKVTNALMDRQMNKIEIIPANHIEHPKQHKMYNNKTKCRLKRKYIISNKISLPAIHCGNRRTKRHSRKREYKESKPEP